MPCGSRSCLALLYFGFALLGASASAQAQTPLRQRIDQAIAAGKPDFEARAAPLATDAEFLRRLYLDLTGAIPTAAQARAFFKDAAPDKRTRLIEQLLAGPELDRRLQEVFDVQWMERRPSKHVKLPEWQEYLRTAFAAKKGYDQIVREMLSADGSDPKTRPAARFYLDRDGEQHIITRDVSRLFLGMNLQCAQCHDHPLVEDYKQDFYYGVFAFFNRSYLVTDKAKKLSVFAEKAEGDVTFQSVFMPKISRSTGPRLPGGKLLNEPKLEKGKEYVIAPAKDVASVPKFSRRAQLADLLLAQEEARFRRTAANRLWALLLGRGLVEPVDFDHTANPPSHPQLLELLATEMAATKYDVRAFLREIVLSKTYQRSSQMPAASKTLPAEKDFALAQLRPLSPEQLAWCSMQATGLTDAERLALGAKATEAALNAKLAGNVAPFVALFGGQPGDPADIGFQTTLDQTLFLRNGATLRGWLTPRAGNLLDRLNKLTKDEDAVEELYLSVLTRVPTAEERQDMLQLLQRERGQRQAALQELAWVLLTSAEFRFNH